MDACFVKINGMLTRHDLQLSAQTRLEVGGKFSLTSPFVAQGSSARAWKDALCCPQCFLAYPFGHDRESGLYRPFLLLAA